MASSFTNRGELFILEGFEGEELSAGDINGVCMFFELGAGVIGGGSATAMLLGMNPVWLGAALAGPLTGAFFLSRLVQSAKALLIFAGFNVGIQANVGAAAYLGYLM